MQLAARIQICIELLDYFFETKTPFDVIASKFFKHNRWIGSSDRREISKILYGIFHRFEEMRFCTKNVTTNLGRAYMLAFLSNSNYEEIHEIFSGKKFAPAPLSTFEKRLLQSLNNLHEIPNWAKLNYPEWLDTSLRQAFPNQFEEEVSALNQRADVILRVNTLKANRDEVLDMLKKLKIECEITKYSPQGIRLKGNLPRDSKILKEGLAEIQDEGSQLIAEICKPQNAKTVVDFCAGAGGKTLALASLMNNKGRIFAMDKYPQRLQKTHVRLKRAGVNNTTCMEISSTWLKRHKNAIDIVLVDAPCSGTGTWRRNPDMRAKFVLQDLQELIEIQRKIIDTAASLVRKEGRLIYATCSVLMEENEDQINLFLKNHPEFSLQKAKYCTNSDYMRLSPYTFNTDGFFGAVLQRN